MYLSPSSEEGDYSVVFFRNILTASKWLPFKASHWGLTPAFANSHFTSNLSLSFFFFFVQAWGSVPLFSPHALNFPRQCLSVCNFSKKISLFSRLAWFCFSLHGSLLTYTPFHVCTYWPSLQFCWRITPFYTAVKMQYWKQVGKKGKSCLRHNRPYKI